MNKFSNLTKRILTALVGAVIIIGAMTYSHWTYFIVFLFIALFTQWEFYRLIRMQNFVPLRILGVLVGAVMFTLGFFIEDGILAVQYYYVIFPLASLGFLFKLYKKNDKIPFINLGFYYLGLLYVALPFMLLNIIVFNSGIYEYQLVLGLLLIIWATDIGAYFAGSMFGKTKLFERISPKKSWEGMVGGAVLAIIFAFLLSFLFTEIPLWEWLGIAGLVIIVGTYGDLVESLFKRSLKIKDSGQSIPGHGGFLDRFDSLILAIPFVVAFIKIF